MRPLLCLTAALLLAAAPSAAQTLVQGILLDAQSSAPIPEARITLSANRGRWQTSVRTDSTGAFSFDDVAAGPYRLRAARIGYREVEGMIALVGDSAVDVELRMSNASVVLAPVTVVSHVERKVSPVLEGFYRRLQRGQGRFITREEIESRNPVRITDLLRMIPSLRAGPQRAGSSGPGLTTGASGGRCSVVIFVDGMQMDYSARVLGARGGTQPSVDDYVYPNEVEGVEIYRGESDTPAEFVTRWVQCGTVVIWSRRG
jgi:hypothetical protein